MVATHIRENIHKVRERGDREVEKVILFKGPTPRALRSSQMSTEPLAPETRPLHMGFWGTLAQTVARATVNLQSNDPKWEINYITQFSLILEWFPLTKPVH